ncbi:hypothetical protein [Pseudomonas sp. 4810-S13]|uniref:hypothetical protein n=1 Tax=Pseudomonas sp. 4810-S13 TaxID=3120822 RepID=UPI0031B6F5E5
MDIRSSDEVAEDIAITIRKLRQYGFRIIRDEADSVNEQQLHEDAAAVGCSMLGLEDNRDNKNKLAVNVIARAITRNLAQPSN